MSLKVQHLEAGYKWLGRGDKNAADGAAVEVMRSPLNKTEISGEIVIGEGEIEMHHAIHRRKRRYWR